MLCLAATVSAGSHPLPKDKGPVSKVQSPKVRKEQTIPTQSAFDRGNLTHGLGCDRAVQAEPTRRHKPAAVGGPKVSSSPQEAGSQGNRALTGFYGGGT